MEFLYWHWRQTIACWSALKSFFLEGTKKISSVNIFQRLKYAILKRHNPGMRIRLWPKKPDPGLCTSNEGRFLKVYRMNILDNCKSLPFCVHTFGVRRTIDVLDPENHPGSNKIRTGSGALGLTGDV